MSNHITGIREVQLAAGPVIILVAGGITFTNDWYQTRNVNWKVPVATVLLAAGIDAVNTVSPLAATSLAVMALIGAATTKFNGKSAADTIANVFSQPPKPAVRKP
jgi:glucokinase